MSAILVVLRTIANVFNRAVAQGIPLLFGSTGEILTEKSGNLNLGIPGIMYVGGISGVIGAFLYENSFVGHYEDMNPFLTIAIPFFATLIGALIMGLIYCFLTVTLRANQNVTGLALTTFGVGFGNFFGASLIKLVDTELPNVTLTHTSDMFRTPLPFADDLSWFGTMFFSYGFLAYLAIILAIIAAVLLRRTRVGLQLRAVGENPATADAAGINVNRYKYVSTCVGSVIAGLGGLYYVMDYANGIWSNNAFGDRGWLAIALVIFAIWKPDLSIFGSILFGALYVVNNYLTDMGFTPSMATQELIRMLPYAVTILVLVITSMRKKREYQAPGSLGLSYFREDR